MRPCTGQGKKSPIDPGEAGYTVKDTSTSLSIMLVGIWVLVAFKWAS